MIFEDNNPYDFNGTGSNPPLRRNELLQAVRDELFSERGSGYLLGGKGMGKTTFLQQLKQDLEPTCNVLKFDIAPASRSQADLKEVLVGQLIETCNPADGNLRDQLQSLLSHPEPQQILYRYLDRKSDKKPLVLLYDEIDSYADPPEFGKRWFEVIEQARKVRSKQLKAFAAGGLGCFRALASQASPFLTGADRFILKPLTRDELSELAKPFRDAGKALSDEILDAIMLQSGGIPRVAIYGLQKVWSETPKDIREIAMIYARFKNDGSLNQTRKIVANPAISKLPSLFWDAVSKGAGTLTEAQVQSLVAAGDNADLDKKAVLDLLESAGLVKVSSSLDVYPIDVRAIPSVLNFEPWSSTIRTAKATLQEQLVTDLREILGLIHSYALDFNEGGEITEEKIFSVIIASNLVSRGWAWAFRESIQGAGPSDVVAIHDKFAGQKALVEVKHRRNNYKKIHEQVESYWTQGVTSAATVMLNLNEDVSDWKNDYEKECLAGKTTSHHWHTDTHPVHGHATAKSSLHSGKEIEVEHFLLHLQRAPTARKKKNT